MGVLLSCILGIACALYGQIQEGSLFLVAVFLPIFFFAPMSRRDAKSLLCLLLAFLLGAAHGTIFGRTPKTSEPRLEGRGKVLEVRQFEESTRLLIRLEEPSSLKRSRVYLTGEEAYLPGQRISFSAKGHGIDSWPHPYGSNEEQRDAGLGVIWRGRIESSRLEETPLFATLRQGMYSRAHRAFASFSEESRELLHAMVLGERDDLSASSQKRLKDWGLAHVLSISGLHLGIFYALCQRLGASLLGSKKRGRYLGLSLSLFYLFLIGWPVSGLRVFCILTGRELLRHVRLPISMPHLIAGAALCQLLVYPRLILSSSFLLSYGAYIGVFLLGPRLFASLSPGEIPRLGALRAVFGAQLGTMPFVLTFSPRVGLGTLFGNLLFLPLYSGLILLGFLHLFVYLLLGIDVALSREIIQGIVAIAIFFHDLLSPFLGYNLLLGQWSRGVFLWFFLTMACVLWSGWRPREKKARRVLFLFAAAGLLLQSEAEISDFLGSRVDFIYVGQGDSTLISSGGKHVLVDTGGSPSEEGPRPGARYTLPYLLGRGILRLDGVILTHLDADHCDGLLDILTEIPVDALYVGRDVSHGVLDAVREVTPVIPVKRGESLFLGDSTIRVISTGLPHTQEENDRSLILRVEGPYGSILLPGDASEKEEVSLSQPGRVDWLHVGHHGSKTSSSERFLNALSPRGAIISCGVRNPYGHPHEEVLERLVARDISVHRLDEEGSLFLDKRGLHSSWDTERSYLGLLVAEVLVCGCIFWWKRKVEHHGSTLETSP